MWTESCIYITTVLSGSYLFNTSLSCRSAVLTEVSGAERGRKMNGGELEFLLLAVFLSGLQSEVPGVIARYVILHNKTAHVFLCSLI